jgi:acyl-CoA synthetase (AMP-forming)/AMP-acid ligase II
MAIDAAPYPTVPDAFRARAAAHPDKPALVVIAGDPGAEPTTVLTFAELDRRAAARAGWLADRFSAGERVLIALPTGAEFAELYLGCLYAGLVAVPASPPGGSAGASERTVGITADCSPSLIVVTADDAPAITAALRANGMADRPVEVLAPGAPDMPGELRPAHRLGPDSLAVLQYSSGSTGSPKGVMLSHRAILANLGAFDRTCGHGSDDVFGSWLPLHHDMGLFAMLTSGLLSGAGVVLMPPTAFVRRPADWLRMMDRYRVTISAAPNFAYELCVRAVRDDQIAGLDLSRIRTLYNGSEPVNPATVRAFTERFVPYGLPAHAVNPCYGMAEFTAYVSTKGFEAPAVHLHADRQALEDAGSPALVPADPAEAREIPGVGRAPDFEVLIVDPDGLRPLPKGRVGEIWLRGPGAGAGYWGREELSTDVFDAVPAVDSHGSGWVRTGDLGATADGELFITGRLKELLIVHGRNLAPHDIEREARAAHDAVDHQIGAAFGVPAPDERIVLVQEVHPRTPHEQLALVASAVTRRLTMSFGVPVRNVLLVRRGTVRRTTSGKIRRTAVRERFLAGDITVLHAELEPALRPVLKGTSR